jgi:hypothetical protein
MNEIKMSLKCKQKESRCVWAGLGWADQTDMVAYRPRILLEGAFPFRRVLCSPAVGKAGSGARLSLPSHPR